MKITTQRTTLWIANLAVFAAMFGLILVIWKNDKNARAQVARDATDDLRSQLKKVKPVRRSGDQGRKDVLDVVMKGGFSGYIPPKKVDPIIKKTGPAVAPELSSLLKVTMVLAPERDSKGNLTNQESHGALVSLTSLASQRGTFQYREGETIGVTEGYDLEPTLKKFGGAVVKRVTIDGITCLWAKKSVTVSINGHGEAHGISLRGGGLNKGIIAADAGTGATVPINTASLGTFRKGAGRSAVDYMTFSKDGMDALDQRGQAILDGVAFETTKGPNKTDALKIKTIPSQLSQYGLRPGDVIVRIDSQAVTSKESIVQYVKRTYRRKRSYRVVYLRNGAQRQLNVSVPQNLNQARRLGGNLSGTQIGRE